MATLPHNRSNLLWEGGKSGAVTKMFSASIDRWIDAMVADEHGGGQSSNVVISAVVTAKQSGVIAGQCVIDRLIQRHFASCNVSWSIEEGGRAAVGDVVLTIEGIADSVLRCERIMLNLLGRMSGIATNTADWVESSNSMGVACTRKTEWGLLDKWAVHMGGGLTHRLDRSDALMVKENDLPALAPEASDELSAISQVVMEIDMKTHASFTVIEVRNREQALAAASAWAEAQVERDECEKIVLLLDNIGPEGCAEVHSKLMSEGLRAWCILEGSGGVKKSQIDQWVTSGVDLISTSALNRGVAPLDLSMRVRGD